MLDSIVASFRFTPVGAAPSIRSLAPTRASVGDTVTLMVVHNGQRRDVHVTLIAKPAGQ